MTTTNPTEAPTGRRRGPSMADVAREAGVSARPSPASPTAATTSTKTPASGCSRRCASSATGRTAPPGPCAPAASAPSASSCSRCRASATCARSTPSPSAAAAAGYSITLIPVQHPTQGEVSVAFSRLSEQAVDGVIIIIEAHLLDEADDRAAARPPGRVVDSDAATVPGRRHRPGRGRAPRHRAPARPRPPHRVARRRPRALLLRRAPRATSWARPSRRTGATVPDVIVGDWSARFRLPRRSALAARPDVTAIFAANDQMALGVLRALHERGRAVPGDVSVVGFDDMAESASFWPPLTTVHQNFDEVGRLPSAAHRRDRGATATVSGSCRPSWSFARARRAAGLTARRAATPGSATPAGSRIPSGRRMMGVMVVTGRAGRTGSCTDGTSTARWSDRTCGRDRRRIHHRRTHRIVDPVALGRRSREHHVGASRLGIPLGAPRHGRRGARALLRDAARVDRARRRLAVRRASTVGDRHRRCIRRSLPARAQAGDARDGGDRRGRVRRAAARHLPCDRSQVAGARDRRSRLAHAPPAATARCSDAPGLVVGLRARARARHPPLPVPRVAHPGARRRRRPRAAWFEAAAWHPDPSLPARLGGSSAPHRPDRRGRRDAATTRSRSAGRTAPSRPRGCSSTSGSCSRHSRSSRGRSSSCRSPSSSTVARTHGTATVSSSSSAELDRRTDGCADPRRGGRLARVHPALPRLLCARRGDPDRDRRRRAPPPVDAGRLGRRDRGLAVPVYLDQRTPYWKNGGTDWQTVAEVVSELARPGDGIVFDESVRPSRRPRLAMHTYPHGFDGLVDLGLVRPVRRDRRAVGCRDAPRRGQPPPRGDRSRRRRVAERQRRGRRRRDASAGGIRPGRGRGTRDERGDGLRARAAAVDGATRGAAATGMRPAAHDAVRASEEYGLREFAARIRCESVSAVAASTPSADTVTRTLSSLPASFVTGV